MVKGALKRDLQKKVLTTRYLFATGPRFQHQLEYSLPKGFIERVSRVVYCITEKGEKCLEAPSRMFWRSKRALRARKAEKSCTEEA